MLYNNVCLTLTLSMQYFKMAEDICIQYTLHITSDVETNGKYVVLIRKTENKI